MSFSFHPDAEAELNGAIEYYEEIEPGLGYDLSIEVFSAIRRAEVLPKAWPVISGEIRRSLVMRFPYGVLYTEDPEGIVIVAVMHLHRHPDYWKHRK